MLDPSWDPTAKSKTDHAAATSDARLDLINLEEIACDHCGYMHKRGEGKTLAGSQKFRERFFVLRDASLLYYKTGAQALGDTATGTVCSFVRSFVRSFVHSFVPNEEYSHT